MRTYRIINPELIEKSRQFLIELEEKKEAKFELAKKLTPFKWKSYYGNEQSWDLLPSFISFKPIEEISELPKGWLKCDDNFLKPNKRTNIGKDFINQMNSIKGFFHDYPDDLLGVEYHYNGRFTPPMIYKSYDDSEYFYKCDQRINLDPEKFEEVLVSYVNSRLNPPKNE